MRGAALVLLVLAVLPVFSLAAEDAFTLRDYLGRQWHNERVRFPLTGAALKTAMGGASLVGPDGAPVPFQITRDSAARQAHVDFLVSLKPFERRTYQFTPRGKQPDTDLRVEETDATVRLLNSRTGVSIRKRPVGDEGPIEAIRLQSGVWALGSRMSAARRAMSYSVEVTARGPVYAEVLWRAESGGARVWQMRVRMQAGDPGILIEEEFSTGDASEMVLTLGNAFAAEHLLYRYGKSVGGDHNSLGQVASTRLPVNDSEPAFVLEPWLHAGERQRQGNWFGIYGDTSSDFVAVGAHGAEVWVDPSRNAAERSPAQLLLRASAGALNLSLPLKRGARKWVLAALKKVDAVQAPSPGADLRRAPWPQQYLIKHGDFPLDRVKDYVLEWAGDAKRPPRLYVDDRDIAALRKRFKPNPERLQQLRPAPVDPHAPDEWIEYYLATGDRELGKNMIATTARWLQASVDMLTKQDALVTMGFAPHHQVSMLTAANVADAIWGSDDLDEDLRARMKAQFAFLAYTVARDDYWSPSRGFAANPNMTTTVATFQTIFGCFLSQHPAARAWVAKGMQELKENQLNTWADDGGGWLEAPHYAMVSYDHLLGAFLAAHRAGFNTHLYDAKMKKVIEWFAKTATPPDPQDGRRYMPPIGNTYMREPSGEFGIVAYLWRERDPAFSAEMQWMFREQGRHGTAGVGGFFPTLAGYRRLLTSDTLAERPPRYRSEWFPKTGVILRNHHPTPRETQLHLIAGTNHAHYDADSGSFTLWGKGRPVANDFGYYGYAPAEDHNMVTTPGVGDDAAMVVSRFETTNAFDYVRGRKGDAWERQIIFSKSADASAPNYFVVSDQLRGRFPGTWRMWFTAQKVGVEAATIVITGHDDVHTDVVFLQRLPGAIKTEARSRETMGFENGKYGRVLTTQTGAIVAMAPASRLTAVLYPRLNSETRPAWTSIAGGNGVKIVTGHGTDYVFMASTPFTYEDEAIRFTGTIGGAQLRKQTEVWLGESGTIAGGGKVLTK